MQQTVVASSASHDSSIGRHFRDVIRPHPGMSRDFTDILLVTSTKQVMRLSRFVCNVCLSHDDRDFYRASYAKRGLGSRNSVRLSVRPSVRLSVCPSHACFETNPKNRPAIFVYHTKGQSF